MQSLLFNETRIHYEYEYQIFLTSSCSLLPQLPLAGSQPPQAQTANFCSSSVTAEWKFVISPTPPKETPPEQ